MQSETGKAQRVAELQRAIAAGDYDPAPDLVAGEIVAKLVLLRRARRRIAALDGAGFEPEVAPRKRQFDPRPEPGTRLSEAH